MTPEEYEKKARLLSAEAREALQALNEARHRYDRLTDELHSLHVEWQDQQEKTSVTTANAAPAGLLIPLPTRAASKALAVRMSMPPRTRRGHWTSSPAADSARTSSQSTTWTRTHRSPAHAVSAPSGNDRSVPHVVRGSIDRGFEQWATQAVGVQ